MERYIPQYPSHDFGSRPNAAANSTTEVSRDHHPVDWANQQTYFCFAGADVEQGTRLAKGYGALFTGPGILSGYGISYGLKLGT